MDNHIPSIIWILFDDLHVGAQTRTKYKSYYTDEHNTWTPIFAIKRTFQGTRKHISIIRTQFPLRPATAKTIHKSQGDTLQNVVVHMGTRSPPHAHYVAMSRVTKVSGLQIMCLNEQQISASKQVKEEMKRLRSQRTLQLCYTQMIVGPYQYQYN